MKMNEKDIDLLGIMEEKSSGFDNNLKEFKEIENFDILKALSKLAKTSEKNNSDDIKIARELIGNII